MMMMKMMPRLRGVALSSYTMSLLAITMATLLALGATQPNTQPRRSQQHHHQQQQLQQQQQQRTPVRTPLVAQRLAHQSAAASAAGASAAGASAAGASAVMVAPVQTRLRGQGTRFGHQGDAHGATTTTTSSAGRVDGYQAGRTRARAVEGGAAGGHGRGAGGGGGVVVATALGANPRPGVPGPARTQANSATALTGLNVCGGQCCPGWRLSPGLQKCTKPICTPACQNEGMCLRPQLCLCKPGFAGQACEVVRAPAQLQPHGAAKKPAASLLQPGDGQPQQKQQQQKQQPEPSGDGGGVPSGVASLNRNPNRSHAAAGRSPQGQAAQGGAPPHLGPQQRLVRQRIIGRQALNRLLSGRGSGRLSHGDPLGLQYVPRPGDENGNYSVPVPKRIKVVFTPTICKLDCAGSVCKTSCSKGNVTTIIAEDGQTIFPQHGSGFRVVICGIPCHNGGRCAAREKCWCPPNFTGKFCQIPALTNEVNGQAATGSEAQVASDGRRPSQPSHSVYMFPLSTIGNSTQVSAPGSLPSYPDLVNVHVKHPPEATVQIHQVARLMDGLNISHHQAHRPPHPLPSPRIRPLASLGGHQHQQQQRDKERDQAIAGGADPSQPRILARAPMLGRCYVDIKDNKCVKPLPGLTRQEVCCGSVGAAWGLDRCNRCPEKLGQPIMVNGELVECPHGFRRENSTHCKDINECQLRGVCPNSTCLNSPGSYTCSCFIGYVFDSTSHQCISDKLLSGKTGLCYRATDGRSCSLPIAIPLTKHICCCSVGKAWGKNCEPCPPEGHTAFRETCPAGMGYHFPMSEVKYKIRKLTEDEVAQRGREPAGRPLPTPADGDDAALLRGLDDYDILEGQQIIAQFQDGQRSFQEISQRLQRPALVEPPPGAAAGRETHHGGGGGGGGGGGVRQPVAGAVGAISSDREPPKRIQIGTSRESPGTVVRQPGGGAGAAPPDRDSTKKIQTVTNICLQNPNICGRGQCVSLAVGYSCLCEPGFQANGQKTQCVDVDECQKSAGLCANGQCDNTAGSFRCVCSAGYAASPGSPQCVDVNECKDPSACRTGRCVNTPGSFHCQPCQPGYRAGRRGQCEDVDECASPGACPSGECVNSLGSFECRPCPAGFTGSGGRCIDENECLSSTTVCQHGRCVNLQGSFRCSCGRGFTTAPDGKSCLDVDECGVGRPCRDSMCRNSPGSFTCVPCGSGYQLAPDGKACKDVDECANGIVCGGGACLNSDGSFRCECRSGFKLSGSGDQCEDIDECGEGGRCQGGECLNVAGSYTCRCSAGYVAVDSTRCRDVDECAGGRACRGHGGGGDGTCINTPGSFRCSCPSGFRTVPGSDQCVDADECEEDADAVCWPHQYCVNSHGSYSCLCDQGFQSAEEGKGCVDVNECELVVGVCGEALCENVEGTFFCVCESEGDDYDHTLGRCRPRSSAEFNEPMNLHSQAAQPGTRPGSHEKTDVGQLPGTQRQQQQQPGGAGQRTPISSRPQPGHSSHTDGQQTHGSPSRTPDPRPGNHDRQRGPAVHTAQRVHTALPEGHGQAGSANPPAGSPARPDSAIGVPNLHSTGSLPGLAWRPGFAETTERHGAVVFPEGSDRRPAAVPARTGSSGRDERKECYYDVDSETACSNVLAWNATRAECCCTAGAGWGVDCAIRPCPPADTEEFRSLCPEGRGNIPSQDPVTGRRVFQDADECTLFGREICKMGRCANSRPGYTCQCQPGYFYNAVKLQCLDIDECQSPGSCLDGQCYNSEGSYNCFCTPPLVLDDTGKRCVNRSGPADEHLDNVHVDICWTELSRSFMCSKPVGRQTTYTECCCLYGEAWGPECAFCPPKSSDDYALLCNIRMRTDVDNFGHSLDPSFGYSGPYGGIGGDGASGPHYLPDPEPNFLDRGAAAAAAGASVGFYEDNVPIFLPDEAGSYPYREGLQAEECGISHGCENGRCVRVPEGFTCDCYVGYKLDNLSVVCVDIDECEEEAPAPCANGRCVNADGSFRCTCDAGFIASQRGSQCLPIPWALLPGR
ncbi:latent-transforming growth factor beta-binding protein 1-like isoform X2 [Lethenteron reissneri]|uniref:latent-transforming growth factor beta-binding protein 1-like isoform X2 n=1 Tax=Lethenteron reissneri TaxID=7753 RepID=UPI002AB6D67B|nr:latent-transforming growth factor beta-binding protein 1-like isoform X2 [Lethenteron reissneri]